MSYALKQAETGASAAEVLRWLQQLEDENRKLKQLVADLSLDKHILQEVLSKKSEVCSKAQDCPVCPVGLCSQRTAQLRRAGL